jgi:photosystem II stability/assembly factor-like uncharacterized protein
MFPAHVNSPTRSIDPAETGALGQIPPEAAESVWVSGFSGNIVGSEQAA